MNTKTTKAVMTIGKTIYFAGMFWFGCLIGRGLDDLHRIRVAQESMAKSQEKMATYQSVAAYRALGLKFSNLDTDKKDPED